MPAVDGESRFCPWCLEPCTARECLRCGSPTFVESEVRPDGTRYSGMVLEQDRYRVLRRLGSGGMGTVHQAFDHILGRLVAIKFVGDAPNGEVDPARADRMVREAMATARIESPHVVRFLDFGRTPHGRPFLVMELLSGRDLHDWLVARHGEPLSAGQVVRLGRQICAALEAAHGRGFIHRDLKPANIFLEERTGDEPFVKVLDFGLAREAHDCAADDPLTAIGDMMGTPDYMAPELGDKVPASPASDLYSLGLILWEMLAGRRPQTGTPLSLLVQRSRTPAPPLPSDLDVPEELADLVHRLLDPSPARRPGSAHAVGLELARLDSGEGLTDRMGGKTWGPAPTVQSVRPASPPKPPDAPTPAPPRAPSPTTGPTEAKNRRRIPIAIAITVGGIVLGGGWWLANRIGTPRIADVLSECGRGDEPVTISAHVVKAVDVPFTDVGAYKVNDGLDDLWVVSAQPAPPKGVRVRLTGRTYDAPRVAQDCRSTGLGSRWCKALSTAMKFVAGSCVLVEEKRD